MSIHGAIIAVQSVLVIVEKPGRIFVTNGARRVGIGRRVHPLNLAKEGEL